MMRFLKNIKRVVEWIPIIWRDQDYDYSFALNILHYKLTRMRDCIVSNNIIADADKVADEIDEVLTYIRELRDSNYDNEWWEHYQQVHDVDAPLDQRQFCTDCRFLLDVAEANEAKTWNNLWLSLNKNMKGWWD